MSIFGDSRELRFLIDCDPGHDDATAILYAARHLALVGITTTYGNQDVENTTRNALRIRTLAGLDVPIARGACRPWVVPAKAIPEAHGKTGLDGADLPEATGEPIAAHAVDFMIEQAHTHRGNLVIAAIGPLTNLATALRMEPKLASWLGGVTIMGGSTTLGNVTPVAEFNIHADPEAASAVFGSGLPLLICGLNVTRQVGVTREQIQSLSEGGGKVSSIFGGLLGFYREQLQSVFGIETASLHDPCALVPFVEPKFIRHVHAHVDVELSPGLTRGMTVCDLRFRGNKGGKVRGGGGIQDGARPNASVAVSVDALATVEHILATIRSYD